MRPRVAACAHRRCSCTGASRIISSVRTARRVGARVFHGRHPTATRQARAPTAGVEEAEVAPVGHRDREVVVVPRRRLIVAGGRTASEIARTAMSIAWRTGTTTTVTMVSALDVMPDHFRAEPRLDHLPSPLMLAVDPVLARERRRVYSRRRVSVPLERGFCARLLVRGSRPLRRGAAGWLSGRSRTFDGLRRLSSTATTTRSAADADHDCSSRRRRPQARACRRCHSDGGVRQPGRKTIHTTARPMMTRGSGATARRGGDREQGRPAGHER